MVDSTSFSAEMPPGSSELRARPRGEDAALEKNIRRVLEEAQIGNMHRDDVLAVAQAAQAVAAKLTLPEQLLDVVAELDELERERLTEALVEAHFVPEEQRGVLEEAVRPGGYADKLTASVWWLGRVRSNAWVVVAMPFVELILSVLLDFSTCGAPLVVWLRVDGILALCSALAFHVAGYTLGPVYALLAADPVGVVRRWQTAAEARSWKSVLETVVPGVGFDTYRRGFIGLASSALCVLLGAAWAAIGLLGVLAGALTGCSHPAILACGFFVGLRLFAAVGLVLFLYYVLDELQRHRSRTPLLGSSADSRDDCSQSNEAFDGEEMSPGALLLPTSLPVHLAPEHTNDFI